MNNQDMTTDFYTQKRTQPVWCRCPACGQLLDLFYAIKHQMIIQNPDGSYNLLCEECNVRSLEKN